MVSGCGGNGVWEGRQVAVKFVKTGNAYGKINLAEGVSEKVYSLEIDGVDQRRGTYGATGSGAKYVNDTLFVERNSRAFACK